MATCSSCRRRRAPRRFPIAGTFYDYTRDQGIVLHERRRHFVPIWKDDRVNSVAVYLQPDGSAGER